MHTVYQSNVYRQPSLVHRVMYIHCFSYIITLCVSGCICAIYLQQCRDTSVFLKTDLLLCNLIHPLLLLVLGTSWRASEHPQPQKSEDPYLWSKFEGYILKEWLYNYCLCISRKLTSFGIATPTHTTIYQAPIHPREIFRYRKI